MAKRRRPTKHPLLEEIKRRGVVHHKEASQIMKDNGINPRGIGGLSKGDRIKWIPDLDSWVLGPKACEY